MVSQADVALSCYISSPLLVDTTGLRELLLELGVTPIGIDDLPTAGQTTARTLESWMRRASFVCAVLPADKSAYIFFEIGLALGLARPIFAIADESADVPTPIEQLPYVRASLADIGSIRFHLEAFLASLHMQSRRVNAAAASVPSPLGRNHGDDAVMKNSSYPERELGNEIAELLGRVSTQVTRVANIDERFEADMLIWLHNLDIGQGAPVLVEIKYSAKEPWPKRVLDSIERALVTARLRAAILITNAPASEMTARLVGGGIVFSVSIEALRKDILAGNFLDDLRRLRNRIFHGAS